MGWSGGSRLFKNVIDAVKHNVGDPDKRYYMYVDLIPAFEQQDWDTQDECLGEDTEYDRALYTLHPSLKQENE